MDGGVHGHITGFVLAALNLRQVWRAVGALSIMVLGTRSIWTWLLTMAGQVVVEFLSVSECLWPSWIFPSQSERGAYRSFGHLVCLPEFIASVRRQVCRRPSTSLPCLFTANCKCGTAILGILHFLSIFLAPPGCGTCLPDVV